MPKVSILVPAYNAGQYLHQCLESIARQTLDDIEVICINDGSQDDTLTIMQEYAHRDSRFLVEDKPNTGYGNSMNVGLDKAKGEYIGIVESDDYVLSDMYRILYGIAKEHDLDLIKSDFISFMEINGERIDQKRKLTSNAAFYDRVIDLAQKESRPAFRFAMNTVTGIYKKAFLDRYSIRYNETPGASYQDNGFWFQTFCRARRAYFVGIPFYMNRRDNPNSSVYSKEKVYCMNEEYAYIYSLVEKDLVLKSYWDVFCIKKFENYMFTYNRVALEHKLMYIRRFCEEFKAILAQKELNLEMFTRQEKDVLQRIMNDPDKYYMERIAGDVDKIDKNALSDLGSMINASRIYKVGLIVTYIPRKARDILQSIKGKLERAKS